MSREKWMRFPVEPRRTAFAYFSFQIALELLEEVGHVRVSFKVTEVIINPK